MKCFEKVSNPIVKTFWPHPPINSESTCESWFFSNFPTNQIAFGWKKIVKMQFVVSELVVGISQQELYKVKESSRLLWSLKIFPLSTYVIKEKNIPGHWRTLWACLTIQAWFNLVRRRPCSPRILEITRVFGLVIQRVACKGHSSCKW